MFLFCLLLAYLIIRVSEDINASVRGHQNPRHEYRMAKLAARENNGGTVPRSSAGRYFTGLLDDAWDSAHHRRQLMAGHRAEKRRRKAAAKIDADRARWAAQDAQPDEPTAHVDPAAPDGPAPIGFDAQAPQVVDPLTDPPTQPLPVLPLTGSTGTPTPGWGSGHPTPTPPLGGPVPAPLPPISPAPGPYVGFDALAPQAADLGTVPWRTGDGVPSGYQPIGEPTRTLAGELSQRAAEVDTDGLDDEAVYPLSEQQQATVDAVREAITTPGLTQIPTADVMALPVSVRADLLDEVRNTPGASMTVVPGAEDIEALALLDARDGGTLDPAEVYTHHDDAAPEVQAAVAADLERIATAQAEAQAAEQPAAPSADPATDTSVDSPAGTSSGVPAGESWEDPDTGFTVPAEATSPCPCGDGTQTPVADTVHADEGDGSASIATQCDNSDCSISSGHDWTPTDAEYEQYFGHPFGEDTDTNPGADAGGGSTTPDITKEDSTPTPNNVIPFQRNNKFTPTRMELPVTTPNSGAGAEVTGLASAITYAQGLAAFCTHTQDQVSAIVPSAEEAGSSCEQARENLATGGVTGPALADIATVQEQVVNAAQAVRTSLSSFEAAAAAATTLQATLERHQQTVGEAYANNPDAGKKEFVTAE